MKKIIFFSVMLCLLVAPAWGAVVIKVVQGTDPNEVKVIYDVNGEPNRIRAFGLDVNVSGSATIYDANWLKWSSKYQIYPGSIDINDSGIVQDYGSPVCDPCGMPTGTTLPGLDSNGVTVEMGSLYVGAPNAPPSTGTLLSLYIHRTGTCVVSIKGNAARVGPNSPPTPSYSPGLVMEDPDQHPGILLQGITLGGGPLTISGTVTCDAAGLAGVTISGLPSSPVTDGSGNYSDATVTSGWSGTAIPTKAGYTFEPNKIVYTNVTTNQIGQNYVADCLYVGRVYTTPTGSLTVVQAMMDKWVFLNKPACWCCAAQKLGNGVYTGASASRPDASDVASIKSSWMKNYNQVGYIPCVDFNLSGRVDASDVAVLKAKWMQNVGTCPTPGLRGTCP
jgi:hypothetical protein